MKFIFKISTLFVFICVTKSAFSYNNCKIDTIEGYFLLEQSANLLSEGDMIYRFPSFIAYNDSINIGSNYLKGIYGFDDYRKNLMDFEGCQITQKIAKKIKTSRRCINCLSNKIDGMKSRQIIVTKDNDKYIYKLYKLKIVVFNLKVGLVHFMNFDKKQMTKENIPMYYIVDFLKISKV